MIDQFIAIIMVAIVLGVDALSLAVAMGLKGVSHGYELKFSCMVGIFHVIMPLLGLKLGIAAGHLLGIWAGRLGAVLLTYLGANMIWKAYLESKPQAIPFGRSDRRPPEEISEGGWVGLTILTTSVSIDALAVGFSLGTLFQTPVFYSAAIIGLVAGTMTIIGFKGGKLFNRMYGSYAQVAGGLVLLGLAIRLAL